MRWSLLPLALTACSVSLETGDVAIICNADADCPSKRCELTIQRCIAGGSDTPLRLNSAVAVSSVRVDAVFNQPVAPGSVVDLSQVSITPSLEVTALGLDADGQRLSVTTSAQAFDVVYTLSVAGLVSNAGDLLDADARAQTFVSFLGLADHGAPAIVRPADGTRVRGGLVDFAWQTVDGASSYTLTITRRDSGDPPVVQTVEGETTVLTQIVLADEGTYDCSVRADVTTDDVQPAAFDVVSEAIYVACPAGVECAARADGANGSRRKPLQRIGEGLVLARLLDIHEVRVAARPDGGTYDESLVLDDAEVTIDGGYDTSFTSGAGRAEIAAIGTVLVVRPALGPIVVRRVLLSALAAPGLQAVSIEGAADLSLEDVMVLAEAPTDSNVGISCDGRPGIANLRLDRVTVVLAGPQGTALPVGSENVGLRVTETKLDVRDSSIMVGIDAPSTGPDASTGVELRGASSIAALRLTAGVGFSRDITRALFDDRTGRPVDAPAYDVIDASRFWTARAETIIEGVGITHLRQLVLRNSVVTTGDAGLQATGIAMANLDVGDGPRFMNVLIASFDDGPSVGINSLVKGYIVAGSFITSVPCGPACGSETHYCVFANGDIGPAMLAGTGLACDQPYGGIGLGTPDFTQPSPVCHDVGNRAIRCSGTVVVPQTVAPYFVSWLGADGNAVASADNDYHLTASAPAALRTGGVSLTGNVCGYADQSLSCEAGTTDADGAARLAPFSMGPYEY